jgi:hypothetical protein
MASFVTVRPNDSSCQPPLQLVQEWRINVSADFLELSGSSTLQMVGEPGQLIMGGHKSHKLLHFLGKYNLDASLFIRSREVGLEFNIEGLLLRDLYRYYCLEAYCNGLEAL